MIRNATKMLSLYTQEFFILFKIIFPLYLIELLFTLIYQTSNIFAGYLPQKNSEILSRKLQVSAHGIDCYSIFASGIHDMC